MLLGPCFDLRNQQIQPKGAGCHPNDLAGVYTNDKSATLLGMVATLLIA